MARMIRWIFGRKHGELLVKRVLVFVCAGVVAAGLSACKKAPGVPAASTTGQPIPGAATATSAGAPPAQPGAPPAVAKPVPAQLPAVVARVNGEAIERWELENAIQRRGGARGRADAAGAARRDRPRAGRSARRVSRPRPAGARP